MPDSCREDIFSSEDITTCVDQSAKALDVERELRFDIEERLFQLSVLNENLLNPRERGPGDVHSNAKGKLQSRL